MGALSVVICAILSHFFLKESLTFFVSTPYTEGSLPCYLRSPEDAESDTLGLDRLCPLHHWRDNPRSECSAATIRHNHRSVQASLPLGWISRLGQPPHRHQPGDRVLHCAEVWKEEYDAAYRHLLVGRWYQRELYTRTRS